MSFWFFTVNSQNFRKDRPVEEKETQLMLYLNYSRHQKLNYQT